LTQLFSDVLLVYITWEHVGIKLCLSSGLLKNTQYKVVSISIQYPQRYTCRQL